ncbi:MAG: CvpA family protein [Dehalococcoidia bacterium]
MENFFDYFSLATIIFFIFKGYKNGIIIEIATGVGIIIGLILAKTFYSELSTNINFLIEEKLTREILSFLSLFVSSIIIANILGRLFKHILGLIFLGQVDKLLGGFFGLFKSIIILKIIIILISNLPVQNQLVDSANNSYVEKNINFDGNYFFTSFKNLLPSEIDDQ